MSTILPTMLYCKISKDLKMTKIRLYECDLLPLVDILDCLGMSEHTFYWVLELWNNTGDIVRHTFGIHGHPQILHFDDVDYLKCLVHACPDWFLDELLFLLETNQFVSTLFKGQSLYSLEQGSLSTWRPWNGIWLDADKYCWRCSWLLYTCGLLLKWVMFLQHSEFV